MRLRTAMAGEGNPCEEVALCTPPEIGVRKSPVRLPLELIVPEPPGETTDPLMLAEDEFSVKLPFCAC